MIVGLLNAYAQAILASGFHKRDIKDAFSNMKQVPEINPKLQEVYDVTRRSQDRLVLLLETISEQSAALRISENRWSMGELAHHIVLTQERILRAIELQLVRAEREELGPDPDCASALHSLDFIAERSRSKFEAREGAIPTRGRLLNVTLPELMSQRSRLEDLLPRLSKRDLRQLKFPHPFFGDFDLYQWILFMGRHSSRHRKQIEEIQQHLVYLAENGGRC